MSDRRHLTLRLGATAALGIVAAMALRSVGAPTLDPPAPHVDAIGSWLDTTPSDVVVMASVRLAALLLAWYLAAASLAAIACVVTRRPELARRLCPPLLARLALGGAVVGLASGLAAPTRTASTTATAASLSDAHGPEASTTSARVTTTTSAPEPSTTSTSAPATLTEPPVLIWTGGPTTIDDAPTEQDDAPTMPDDVASAPDEVGQQLDVWTIEPGDHLWSVAAETVRESTPEPTEAEIARYWLALIELNRSTLVDPENPDLVLPGQQIALPPVPH